MSDTVTLRKDDRITVLTLNRPDRRNAITPEMREAIGAALDAASADTECGAIVIRGAGRAFCAGGDVREMGGMDPEAALERVEAIARVSRKLLACEKPLVACVEGPAFGAGLSIAAAACHVVAAPDARFCAPFSQLGLTADWGLSWSLPRRVGHTRARRMCLLAEVLDAEQALATGLVDEIAPPAAALDRALDIAGRLARRAPLATAATLRLFAEMPASPDAALAREGAEQAVLMQTTDHRTGIAAFLDKPLASCATN